MNKLILYKNFKHENILDDAEFILSGDTVDDDGAQNRMNSFTGSLVELAASHGYNGNLWQAYLTYLIANNENAYSTACEMRGETKGTVSEVALHDFAIFREMFSLDLDELDKLCGTDNAKFLANYAGNESDSKEYNQRIRDRILSLRDQLATSSSDEEFATHVAQFYKEYGVGKFGLHKAFRVEKENGAIKIEPITRIAHVYLEDLVGYESAKKKLVDNTEAFIEGRPCNNCLLFGDAGTGKSSSIKGLANRYFDRGLRIIEVFKHQLSDLPEIIATIKNRNYRFIIYMDDLSFEEYETEYKYLKAVIEGGLEKKPENVLIYATSNRRHIVREKFSDKEDRDDDLHTNDTVSEKLSLAYRFGVTIFFGRPDRKEFEEIVRTLAKRNDVGLDEKELLAEANKWELSHGGLSGRTAQQFVDMLLGGAR